MLKTVLVRADDGLHARVDAGLSAGSRLLDAHLGHTGLDGFGHTSEFLYLLDVLPCLVHQLVGQCLDVVGTGPRVYLLAHLCLVLYVYLSVAGYTCREVCRQCDSLVESVGVQRLCVAEYGGHSLDTCTAHVVERILFRQRPSRCLRVGAQSERLRVLGTEALHDLGPQQTSGAHLGYLHEVVHADGPEERQARGKGIDVDAGVHSGTDIVHTVGQRVCQLDVGSGSRFLHVVSRD